MDGEGGRYYVLDFWVPQGWESGLWVRGILEAPENPQTVTNLVFIAVVTLPAFILLAALGGYGIVHRAFRPLEEITATAAAINEAADLSARVAVPPGDHEFSRLADTFNQMFGRLEAVSYTHLDVYKRQPKRPTTVRWGWHWPSRRPPT